MEQMKINTCKIGNGFFCRIPLQNEFITLRVLFTNNHVFDKNDIKNWEIIKFTLQNGKIEKKIKINNTGRTYTNKDLDKTKI